MAAIEIARDQTRAALQQVRDDLERRVEERTIELQKSNEQLKQEISQRKVVEDALRESEEKYRLIWQNANEGIFIATEGKLQFLNPRIVEIMGHSLEELLSKPFTAFIHPDDGHLVLSRHYRRLKGEAVPSRYPFRLVDINGDVKWVEIDNALCTWEGRPAVLGLMTDITERKLMEEELSKHRHQLKEMVEERTAELKRANDQLVMEITERKKTEKALAQSEKQLRLLSAQLLTAQERERKRVAQELHDGIGQSLTVIKFKVENALNHANESLPQAESFKSVIPVIQDAVEEVRRISMDLRPSILDDLGVLATITWFCREFQTIYSRIRIDKQLGLEENDISKRLKIVIFRVLQEALNNVAKHSNADSVRLSLQKKGSAIDLVVQDNGDGFDPEAAFSSDNERRGFGLASMKERTESRGGHFEIVSRCREGTVIRAVWPSGGPKFTRR